MKQTDLRRALLVLTLFCIFLFIYLYWQQSSSKLSTTNFHNYKQTYTSYNAKRHSLPPVWTWECVNARCERHPITSNSHIASQSTCAMLCGSTQLWPQPTGPVTLSSKAATFRHTQIKMNTSSVWGPCKHLLHEAYNNFNHTLTSLVQNVHYTNKLEADINDFQIVVLIQDQNVVKLTLKVDESYKLVVKSTKASLVVNIVAKTFFGARHALETLSQLMWWDEYKDCLKIIKGASIEDRPKIAYRGLMVDTSRNFMSMESLKRVLVGMSANKLNVFHWHITDSQSFPFVAPRVPLLAKTGAYSAEMVYSPEEIRFLVEFARVRGIRIILEVDSPAHAGNGWTWGPAQGLGELAVCVNERPWSMYCGEPPCGQLNPYNPNVYNVLEDLYRDIIELGDEEEFFHLGGDEVNLECWAQQSPVPNYTDLHDLWGDFTVKALNRLKVANNNHQIPNIIVWSSRLSKRPYLQRYLNRSNIVVQSWGSSQWPDTMDLIQDGYKVIISHVDAWYLDCGFGRWRETGEAACDPYRPWQTVYNHRPWQQFQPIQQKEQILGGEVCLWSEQFDENSLDARLWPRAAAFAERLWTDPVLDTVTYTIREDVYTRLNTQRDRLVNRGLKAEAIWPQWCAQNPGMCL